MRTSKLFGKTLREVPAEAETVSHQLLLRTGMIHQVAAGVYSYLPLGWMVLKKIENMNKLFALAVEWPWFTGLLRRLIKLPPNGLFRLVYKLWKGYAVKNRIHPYRPTAREFVQTVRRFMKFD